ncbi:MAG: hypothetical protein DRP09_15845 [Candidatus Thorarchaeota archaeon]|nr:MAG: hypothetical protein DRP09_15845 [Candidatus Thorarchaeota archaeon]
MKNVRQPAFSDPKFNHTYGSEIQLTMCGCDTPIPVIVRLAGDNERPTHWAWWDARKLRFSMIFKSKVQLDMCFPYGRSVAEDSCDGVGVEVVVAIK